VLRHDFKNSIDCIARMIQQNKREDALHYAEQLKKRKIGNIQTNIECSSSVINAVLNSKFSDAHDKDIATSFKMVVQIPESLEFDISIILSNLLDNAIEACVRMREKQPDAKAYITIRSFKAKNMYFIEIENSFDGVALFHKESGLPISTKKDKEVHGIGLKNIRKCAVKYGGDLDCIVEGNKFTLSVMVKS